MTFVRTFKRKHTEKPLTCCGHRMLHKDCYDTKTDEFWYCPECGKEKFIEKVRGIANMNESIRKQEQRAALIIDYLRPCTKFKNATIFQQYKKMKEELAEVKEAAYDFDLSESQEDLNHLAMEIADLMVCGTTALNNLGIDINERMNIYKKVFDKNDARNYYSEQKIEKK